MPLTTTDAHEVIDPAILYWGTPVAVLSTVNPDGSVNLAPMSSIFWLGREATLGLGPASHSLANMQRTREVTICLPSIEQADAVDRLALTTGANPVHPGKIDKGYRHVADKFGRAGLLPSPSVTVAPPAVAEMPVAMEATVTSLAVARHAIVTAEITRVRIHPMLRLEGHPNRIDPLRWRPLLMSFQRFFGMGDEVRPSELATIEEESYR